MNKTPDPRDLTLLAKRMERAYSLLREAWNLLNEGQAAMVSYHKDSPATPLVESAFWILGATLSIMTRVLRATEEAARDQKAAEKAARAEERKQKKG